MNLDRANSRTRPTGFTLIEILIVAAILATLMTIVVGVTKEVMTHAARNETRLMMQTLYDGMQRYSEVNKDASGQAVWPANLDRSNFDNLGTVNPAEMYKGKFYKNGAFVDSWGRPLTLITGGERFAQNNNCPLLRSEAQDPDKTGDDIYVP